MLVFAGRTLARDSGSFAFAVIRAPSQDAAHAIAEDDPAVAGGVFRAEVFPFQPMLMGAWPRRRRLFRLRPDASSLLVALCLVLAGAAHADDWSAWQRAYDPATRTRFIPVELWTGAPWDGTQEIRMAPAALEFGPRGDKSIKGPKAWNGMQVYERLNREKLQLFAIRDDQTGLGRVFDSRYPQRGCRGEVKFPLGRWKQGEVREYRLDCTDGRQRPLKVTIEELDYVYEGVPHSLRFHWLLSEGRGPGTDMRYVYSPLRGLVNVQGNE